MFKLSHNIVSVCLIYFFILLFLNDSLYCLDCSSLYFLRGLFYIFISVNRINASKYGERYASKIGTTTKRKNTTVQNSIDEVNEKACFPIGKNKKRLIKKIKIKYAGSRGTLKKEVEK